MQSLNKTLQELMRGQNIANNIQQTMKQVYADKDVQAFLNENRDRLSKEAIKRGQSKLYEFFRKQYDCECYFAVSAPLEKIEDVPEEFRKLESLLEEQFYQPGQHVLISGEEAEGEDAPAEDSELMDRISGEIRQKDVIHLKQDFGKLEQKYRGNRQFSEMYVKFVFSGILKELYDSSRPGMKRSCRGKWTDCTGAGRYRM